MNLHLDDDTADRRLVALLRNAGYMVVVPANVQLSGASDARHFMHAMQHALLLMTKNHNDFWTDTKLSRQTRAPILVF
jgi:hypothetical protein